MKLFQRQLFWGSLAGIAIVETASLAAYHFDSQILQIIGFAAVFLSVLILSLKNIEYGVLIAFVELFVSSFGRLFQLELGPLRMSMRIGIFFAIQIAYNTMLVTHLLRNKIGGRFLTRVHAFFQTGLRDSRILTYFFHGPYVYPNWAIFGALVLAVTLAFINKHDLQNIFHDADAYVTLAYFPIIFAAFAYRESRLRLYTVFLASFTWIAAQTALVLYVFSHRLRESMFALYLWIRDARIGEITLIGADFYRIFFQSYIFVLVAAFVLAIFLLGRKSKSYALPEKYYKYVWWLFVLAIFIMLISFSRSFWFGGVIGGIILLATWPLLNKIYPSPTKISLPLFRYGLLKIFGGIAVAFLLILAVVNFPLPSKGAPVLLTDLFSDRAVSLSDSAAASRWNLLPVLWTEIKKNPILGAGFGKTVTYITTDPRILAEDPTGTRTTYAFEWGYLDLWLKLGIPGLLAFGWLVGLILLHGWRRLREECTPITYGVWLGVIALLATHVFSPYLNHPLGIGILIFAASVFQPLPPPLRDGDG